jgi:transposase
MRTDQLSEVQSSGILTVSSGASLVSHPPEARTVPDPEVSDKALRRQFAAKYKRRILEELDRCSEPGQVGALLRREGESSAKRVCCRLLRRRSVVINPLIGLMR